MKKVLLSCAVISLFSSNVFAGWDIHKGRLINEKKWTTSNNIQLTFDNVSAQKHFVDPKIEDFYDYSVDGKIYSSKGSPNVITPIKTNELLWLVNKTNKTKTYTYSTGLCVDTGPNKYECVGYTTDIELEPYGIASLIENPVMHVKFEKPGTYKATKDTHLDDCEDKEFYLASYSSSNIEIS